VLNVVHLSKYSVIILQQILQTFYVFIPSRYEFKYSDRSINQARTRTST